MAVLVRCVVCGKDEPMVKLADRSADPPSWVCLVAAHWPPGCFDPEQGTRALRVCGVCLVEALAVALANRLEALGAPPPSRRRSGACSFDQHASCEGCGCSCHRPGQE